MSVRAAGHGAGGVTRTFRLIWVTALVATLAACGGTRGFTSSCRYSVGGGSCDGSYDVLGGRTLASVDDDHIVSTDALQIRTEVSVEQGRVRASFESPDGAIESAEATPGNPVVLEGVAKPYVDGPELYFEPIDGDATQVQYGMQYSIVRNGGDVERGETRGTQGTIIAIGIVALAAIAMLVLHFKRGARAKAS